MTTAAKRARKKARARSAHEHVPGERCTRCRPLPQEPGQAVWRASDKPLEELLVPSQAARRNAVDQSAALMATSISLNSATRAKRAMATGLRRVGRRGG